MKTIIPFVALMTSIALVSAPARAEDYADIPDKEVSWSINEPAQQLGSAYEHSKDRFYANGCVEGPLWSNNPTGDVTFSLRSDYGEATRTLGLEASARFRTSVAGGSASAKFVQNSAESGYSMTLFYKNQSQYFENFDIGEGKNMTRKAGFVTNDPRVFRQSCGTQFISKTSRIASLLVQVVIRFTSKEALQESRAKVEMDFNSGAYSGGAEAGFKKMEHSLTKQTKVDISVVQIGGTPGQAGMALCPGKESGQIASGISCGDYAIRCGGGELAACQKFLADVSDYAAKKFSNQLQDKDGKLANYAENKVWVTTYNHALLGLPPPASEQQERLFQAQIKTLQAQFERYFKAWVKANNVQNLKMPRISVKQSPIVQLLFSRLDRIVKTINQGVMDCYSGGFAGCSQSAENVNSMAEEASKEISDEIKARTGETVTLSSPEEFAKAVDKFSAPEDFTQYCDVADDSHPDLKYTFDAVWKWLQSQDEPKFKEIHDKGDPCFKLSEYMKDVQTLKLDGTELSKPTLSMDLTPLAKLPNLTALTVVHGNVQSVSALAQAPNLKTLDLQWNRIQNPCDLAKSESLERISLRDNRLRDASCLFQTSSLRSLDLRGNGERITCPQSANFLCKSEDLASTVSSSDLPPIQAPLLGSSPAQLTDGSVLIAGGLTPTYFTPASPEDSKKITSMSMTASAALFRCTGSRCFVVGQMKDPRAFATANAVGPNNVVIAGGQTATIEIYRPQSQTTSLSRAHLSFPKAQHTATVTAGGFIVYVGGYFQTDAGELRTTAPTRTYDVYDPKSDSIVGVGDLRLARAEHSATLLPDGRIVVAGGFGPERMLDQIEIIGADLRSSRLLAARLSTARAGHAAILDAKRNKIYFIGGLIRKATGELVATDSVEILNLDTMRVEDSTEHLSVARGGIASVQVADDRYVLLGGTASVNLINPFLLCEEQDASAKGKCVETSISDGKIKIKAADAAAVANVDIFNLKTSSLDDAGTINHARAGMVAAPLNFSMDAVLIFGGVGPTPKVVNVPEVLVYK